MNSTTHSSSSNQRWQFWIDRGGTFTDVAAFDARTRKLLLGKTLSTPSHLVEGINTGVAEAGADVADASLFLHGSTIAINTVLERKGALTALVTTKGFRDVFYCDCFKTHNQKNCNVKLMDFSDLNRNRLRKN